DGNELFRARRRHVPVVRAAEGPEHADCGNGADARDPVDGRDGVLRRLETGDDLALDDPGLEPATGRPDLLGAVLDGAQVAVETVLAILPGADGREPLTVEELEAERD